MSKPDKKPAKKADKPKNAVIKDDAKTAVDDSAYQKYLAEGINICRTMEADNLIGFWNLGSLVNRFVELKEKGEFPGRDLDQFASDLEIDKGVSTLYFSRQIHLRYKREALPKMAAQGFGISIMKRLLPLDKALLTQVEDKLIKEDGSLVSTRELEQIIVDLTRGAAKENAQKAIESTPTPSRARAERQVEHQTDSSGPEEIQPEPTTVDKALAAVAAKPDDGKTGSRGATPTKEYSHSPLKALKAIETASSKVQVAAADAIISATEIVKIGFDHPTSKDNARKALSAAHGAVKDLLTLLPDLESRLREALEDVQV